MPHNAIQKSIYLHPHLVLEYKGMLSRRQIRVRAMQSLYGLHRSRNATKDLAIEKIEMDFMPDLNSMEPQDKKKLEGLRKLGKFAFEEIVDKKQELDQSLPLNLQNSVQDAYHYYTNQNSKESKNILQKALWDADFTHVAYLYLLELYVLLAKRATNDNKLETASHLGKNRILKVLEENTIFENLKLRNAVSFPMDNPLLKELYVDVLKKNERYLEYCSKINHTDEEELAILKYMMKNVFLKDEKVESFFMTKYLYFDEDKDTLRALINHTFSPFLEERNIHILSPDEEWPEKKDFLQTLIDQSIEKEEELEGYIFPKLKNWDFERIPETDKLLLRMALVEMLNYTSIPVKVTINEYIEIAKMYSTPRSSKFINGILDVLSKELVQKGIIKKSGRGMLDNK